MRPLTIALALVALCLVPDLAFAADEAAGASPNWGIAVGAGLAMGLAAGNAVAGIARNPGAGGTIATQMIIGLALIESLALISFVIAILLTFRV